MTEAVLEAGSWIYKMFITLVLAVIVVGIVGFVVRAESNTIDVQRELLFNRILYEPQGFWYVDGNSVMHPAILEKTAFTQEHADATFMYAENYGGANITLIDSGPPTTVYINQPTYLHLAVGAEAGIAGAGTLVTRTYPIIVHDGNTRRNAWLRITVAMPAKA